MIEFTKSKYGWISITDYGVVIGTIFINPERIWFQAERPEDTFSIEYMEQIITKMKALQDSSCIMQGGKV